MPRRHVPAPPRSGCLCKAAAASCCSSPLLPLGRAFRQQRVCLAAACNTRRSLQPPAAAKAGVLPILAAAPPSSSPPSCSAHREGGGGGAGRDGSGACQAAASPALCKRSLLPHPTSLPPPPPPPQQRAAAAPLLQAHPCPQPLSAPSGWCSGRGWRPRRAPRCTPGSQSCARPAQPRWRRSEGGTGSEAHVGWQRPTARRLGRPPSWKQPGQRRQRQVQQHNVCCPLPLPINPSPLRRRLAFFLAMHVTCRVALLLGCCGATTDVLNVWPKKAVRRACMVPAAALRHGKGSEGDERRREGGAGRAGRRREPPATQTPHPAPASCPRVCTLRLCRRGRSPGLEEASPRASLPHWRFQAGAPLLYMQPAMLHRLCRRSGLWAGCRRRPRWLPLPRLTTLLWVAT